MLGPSPFSVWSGIARSYNPGVLRTLRLVFFIPHAAALSAEARRRRARLCTISTDRHQDERPIGHRKGGVLLLQSLTILVPCVLALLAWGIFPMRAEGTDSALVSRVVDGDTLRNSA